MTIGKLSAGLLLIALASGCSSRPGRVSEAPPIPDNQLKFSTPANETALIVTTPKTLRTNIKNNAEGFSGGSCMISFNLYPYLYTKMHEKFSKYLKNVDISTDNSRSYGYDYTIKASIGEVVWYSEGWAEDRAAVKLRVDVSKGDTAYASYEAFEEGAGKLGRMMAGCQDAATTTAIASTQSINYGLNKIVTEFDGRERTAATGAVAGSGTSAETETLLKTMASMGATVARVTSDTPDMHDPEDYARMDCPALAEERAVVLANQNEAEGNGAGLGALGVMGFALQGAAIGTGNAASAMQMQITNANLSDIRDDVNADSMAYGERLNLLDQIAGVRKCKG